MKYFHTWFQFKHSVFHSHSFCSHNFQPTSYYSTLHNVKHSTKNYCHSCTLLQNVRIYLLCTYIALMSFGKLNTVLFFIMLCCTSYMSLYWLNELQVPQTDVTNEEIINNTASLTNTERYDGIIMYHNTTLPDHYNSLFYKADLRPLIDQAKQGVSSHPVFSSIAKLPE